MKPMPNLSRNTQPTSLLRVAQPPKLNLLKKQSSIKLDKQVSLAEVSPGLFNRGDSRTNLFEPTVSQIQLRPSLSLQLRSYATRGTNLYSQC